MGLRLPSDNLGISLLLPVSLDNLVLLVSDIESDCKFTEETAKEDDFKETEDVIGEEEDVAVVKETEDVIGEEVDVAFVKETKDVTSGYEEKS